MLTNIYWLLPEVVLSVVCIVLIGFAVVLSKMSGKVSQLNKINWLSILCLFLTGLLLLEQLGWSSGSTVSISNDFVCSNELVTTIKLVLVWSSAIVLVLGLKSTVDSDVLDWEFSQLVLLSTVGMMLLVSCRDFIMLYLAVELLSLSFYVLSGLKKGSQHSTEASLKYFLLGALSSGLLLFGMCLIYAFTGELNFVNISEFLWYNDGSSLEIVIGAAFIVIAILFKLAAAPFHMWAPDVYEGSPTIVTAFFAIVPKIGTLGLLIILLNGPFVSIFYSLQPVLIFSAVLSLLVGSIGALNQSKMKRLVAYSAISHIGFLLIGVLVNSIGSVHATLVYIFLYILMSVNTFTFVCVVFKEGTFISELSGLSRYNKVLAFTFAFTLLSIAGIPPLAGFLSKYLILNEAIQNGFFGIGLIGVLCSCVSTFYYLRIIKWMFFKDTEWFHYKDLGDVVYPTSGLVEIPFRESILLGSSLFVVLTFLLYPTPFLTFSLNVLSSSFI